tara:strand:- start:913 stop:1350 length:438 start_codon:yes stop_codon:yes gene_type:complete
MADLSIKITEDIELQGHQYGGTKELTITGINEVSRRVVTATTTDTTIISFGTAYGAGTFIEGDVRYIRITNLDSSNYVLLNIEGDTSTDFTVRLDPGASYMIISSSSTGVVDYADISGSTLEDLTAIKADANSSSCDLEILVATV